MRTLVRLALCGVAVCAPLGASAQSKSAGPRTTYLVVYHPGPGWIAGKPVAEQPLKEHGKYILSLYIKGALKLAGPFLDDSGGAVVLEAESDVEAKAVVSGDPAVIGRVFIAEVHPWRLVDWEQYSKKQRPDDAAELALMHLTSFEEHGVVRSWNGHDWEVLNRLHERGWISNPVSKTKSVILTEEGARLSNELFEKLFL